MLQLVAGFASSLSEAVFWMLPPGPPVTSTNTKYVVSFSRSMPAPDAVNAARPSLGNEAGFVSVPRLASGDPLLSERMLTVKRSRFGVAVVWISTLVSV